MLERMLNKFIFLCIAPIVYHVHEDSFIFQPIAPSYGIWISTGTVISFVLIALFILYLRNSAASPTDESSPEDSNPNTLSSQDKCNTLSNNSGLGDTTSRDETTKKD